MHIFTPLLFIEASYNIISLYITYYKIQPIITQNNNYFRLKKYFPRIMQEL